jgi:hypothetical protein
MSLCERFHRLFELNFSKDIIVDMAIRSFGSCLLFRRTLWGDLANDWFDLLNIIYKTVLRDVEDRVSWNLGKKALLLSLYIMQCRLDNLLKISNYCGI